MSHQHLQKLYIGFILLFGIPGSQMNGFCQHVNSQVATEERVREVKKYNPQPELMRGPYLQSATSNSIIIRWRTNAADRGIVRYGTSPDSLLFSTVEKPVMTMEHIIQISNLKPETKYYYSIGGLEEVLQKGIDNYFITLPTPGTTGKYRIGIFGDCGNNSVNQREVRDQVLSYLGNNYMNAWLLLGDNAYESGTDAEYQVNFFNVYKDDLLKKYPLFPSPGNHDYRDINKYRGISQKSQDIPYFQNFSMPVNGEAGGLPSGNPAYYSFDIGNIHFLSLDSYGKDSESYRMYDTLSAQVEWVKKDLEENKNKDWVVAYWHHPPYSMASHNSDKENELVKIRENFLKILERYGVDLVLCGHSHGYERSKLMKGHYDFEPTFNIQKHQVSTSSAFYDGSSNSCPYIKSQDKNAGTVYVVSGSAGKVDSRTQESFPHDAMIYSNATIGGAAMLEVEENRLDLKWICSDGIIRDQFTMMKKVNKKSTIRAKPGEAITLTASFIGKYRWDHGDINTRSIKISPKAGTTIYTVRDQLNCVQEIFEVIVSKKNYN